MITKRSLPISTQQRIHSGLDGFHQALAGKYGSIRTGKLPAVALVHRKNKAAANTYYAYYSRSYTSMQVMQFVTHLHPVLWIRQAGSLEPYPFTRFLPFQPFGALSAESRRLPFPSIYETGEAVAAVKQSDRLEGSTGRLHREQAFLAFRLDGVKGTGSQWTSSIFNAFVFGENARVPAAGQLLAQMSSRWTSLVSSPIARRVRLVLEERWVDKLQVLSHTLLADKADPLRHTLLLGQQEAAKLWQVSSGTAPLVTRLAYAFYSSLSAPAYSSRSFQERSASGTAYFSHSRRLSWDRQFVVDTDHAVYQLAAARLNRLLGSVPIQAESGTVQVSPWGPGRRQTALDKRGVLRGGEGAAGHFRSSEMLTRLHLTFHPYGKGVHLVRKLLHLFSGQSSYHDSAGSLAYRQFFSVVARSMAVQMQARRGTSRENHLEGTVGYATQLLHALWQTSGNPPQLPPPPWQTNRRETLADRLIRAELLEPFRENDAPAIRSESSGAAHTHRERLWSFVLAESVSGSFQRMAASSWTIAANGLRMWQWGRSPVLLMQSGTHPDATSALLPKAVRERVSLLFLNSRYAYIRQNRADFIPVLRMPLVRSNRDLLVEAVLGSAARKESPTDVRSSGTVLHKQAAGFPDSFLLLYRTEKSWLDQKAPLGESNDVFGQVLLFRQLPNRIRQTMVFVDRYRPAAAQRDRLHSLYALFEGRGLVKRDSLLTKEDSLRERSRPGGMRSRREADKASPMPVLVVQHLIGRFHDGAAQTNKGPGKNGAGSLPEGHWHWQVQQKAAASGRLSSLLPLPPPLAHARQQREGKKANHLGSLKRLQTGPLPSMLYWSLSLPVLPGPQNALVGRETEAERMVLPLTDRVFPGSKQAGKNRLMSAHPEEAGQVPQATQAQTRWADDGRRSMRQLMPSRQRGPAARTQTLTGGAGNDAGHYREIIWHRLVFRWGRVPADRRWKESSLDFARFTRPSSTAPLSVLREAAYNSTSASIRLHSVRETPYSSIPGMKLLYYLQGKEFPSFPRMKPLSLQGKEPPLLQSGTSEWQTVWVWQSMRLLANRLPSEKRVLLPKTGSQLVLQLSSVVLARPVASSGRERTVRERTAREWRWTERTVVLERSTPFLSANRQSSPREVLPRRTSTFTWFQLITERLDLPLANRELPSRPAGTMAWRTVDHRTGGGWERTRPDANRPTDGSWENRPRGMQPRSGTLLSQPVQTAVAKWQETFHRIWQTDWTERLRAGGADSLFAPPQLGNAHHRYPDTRGERTEKIYLSEPTELPQRAWQQETEKALGLAPVLDYFSPKQRTAQEPSPSSEETIRQLQREWELLKQQGENRPEPDLDTLVKRIYQELEDRFKLELDRRGM